MSPEQATGELDIDGNASAYLVYLPESLEIRRAAAAALGLTERAREYQTRLQMIRGGGR